MGMLDAFAGGVAAGQTVSFRPTGSSMVPLIRSRDLVVVAPVDPAMVEVGDIVLAKVAGTVYLHLVSAVDHGRGRVQISNNRGRVNGWTSHSKVYGICTMVAGTARPAIGGKLTGSVMEPTSAPHSVLDERALAIVEQVRAHADLTDAEAVVRHLARRGLGFLQCVLAARQLLGIGLGDAKILVHNSVFTDDRQARERLWQDLHTAAKRDLPQ